ncbi:MAG: sialidase family protein [Candidatus Diapherotrites archaeon]|nr:sialidase family protein [Candidatus Diapherotrites archaeon]
MPRKITDLNVAGDFSVFADGQNIYLAWQEDGFVSNFGKIYFIKSLDLGNTWSPAKLLYSGNYVNVISPVISFFNGKLHLVWLEKGNTGEYGTIYYSNSSDSGLNWSAKKQISSSSRYPAMLPNGSKILVSFTTSTGLYTTLSSDSGANWSSIQKLSDYNGRLNCELSGNNQPVFEKNVLGKKDSPESLIISWSCGNAIFVRKSVDFGLNWSQSSRIIFSRTAPWRFSISSNSEGFHMVFGSFLNTDTKFYYYKSVDGLSWSLPEEINVDSFVNFPRILSGNGFIIASWDNGRSTGYPGLNEVFYSTKQQKACSSSSSCGQDSWLSMPFCSFGSASDTFRTFSCDSGFCFYNDENRVIEACPNGCANGSCNQCAPGWICSDASTMAFRTDNCGLTNAFPCSNGCYNGSCNSNECNSGQTRCSGSVKQTCSNYDSDSFLEWPSSLSSVGNENCSFGCSNGNCNSPLCSSNSDCGTNDFTGNPFCKNNKVYQKFKTFSCKNSGTQNAKCSNSTSDRLVESCLNGCSNGACKQPACIPQSYQSCSNNDLYWFDSCKKKQELAEDCGSNSCDSWSNYCEGNKVKKERYCYTKGCSSNSCFSNSKLESKTVQTCSSSQTCSGGKCVNQSITCSSNSQCGTDAFAGSKFCQSGSVYQNYQSFTCNNAGSSNASCSSSNAARLVENCSNGCSGGACSGSSGVSVTVTEFTDSIEKDFIGSLEWQVSGSIKETGVEYSPYTNGTSISKVSYPKINISGNYASILALRSCTASGAMYFRAYAVGKDNSKKTSDWKAVSLVEFCTPKAVAVSAGISKSVLVQKQGLSSATCYDNSDVCVQDEIPFTIEEVDWVGLGWEGAKFFTIGSCLDDGWFTVWCAFDAGSTVLMIVPAATLETGAVKALNVLAKGSKIIKIIGTAEKISTTTRKINLILNGAKKSTQGSKVARAAELALLKIDFASGKITSKFPKLTEWFVSKGESAIVRLKGSGASNEILEGVIKNGGKDLEVVKYAGKDSSSAVRWIEKGTNDWGWQHLWKKHVTGEISGGTRFSAVTSNVSESNIKKLVFDTVGDSGSIKKESSKVYCYFSKAIVNGYRIIVVVDKGIDSGVGFGKNGAIKTAYPRPAENLTCN